MKELNPLKLRLKVILSRLKLSSSFVSHILLIESALTESVVRESTVLNQLRTE